MRQLFRDDEHDIDLDHFGRVWVTESFIARLFPKPLDILLQQHRAVNVLDQDVSGSLGRKDKDCFDIRT